MVSQQPVRADPHSLRKRKRHPGGVHGALHPACNPYLALAVCLAAGLDGVKRNLTPPEEIKANIFAMTPGEREKNGIRSLPANLKEAIDAMEADGLIMDTLGEHASAAYLTGKKQEWDEYRTSISQWEVDRYLIRY